MTSMNQAGAIRIGFVVLADRLDHAEGRAVAHAEDDVGIGGELLLGDALGAGGIVVGGLTDDGVDQLGIGVAGLETLGETDGHVVPGRRLAGNDDTDGAGRGAEPGQDAGEIGDFLRLGFDIGHQIANGGRVLDHGHGHAVGGGEVGAGGLIATGVADDQTGAFIGQVLEGRGDVVVAAVLLNERLDTEGRRGRVDAIGALLIPPEVGNRGGGDEADLLDGGRQCRGGRFRGRVLGRNCRDRPEREHRNEGGHEQVSHRATNTNHGPVSFLTGPDLLSRREPLPRGSASEMVSRCSPARGRVWSNFPSCRFPRGCSDDHRRLVGFPRLKPGKLADPQHSHHR